MKKSISILALFFIACGGNQNQTKTESGSSGNANDAEIIQTAKDAYIFSFPLMVMHATQRVMTNVDPGIKDGPMTAPINQLKNATYFPDDKFRAVVRPNNDTYYTSGFLDLKSEPLVLELPNTSGRYYLFPMLDAWTNVFFSPGKRTTGTEAQTYLITGPSWSGEVPDGMQQVKSPTAFVWMIGRTQVNSAMDGATAVKKIQDGYKLTPLSAYGKPYTPPQGKADPDLPKKSPNDIVLDMSVSDYFNLFNKLMMDNPPLEDDAPMMKKLEALGIAPGAAFDASKFSDAVQDSLKNIPAWGKNTMVNNGLGGIKAVNGWNTNSGLGNYGTNYLFRAGVAFGGLGANLDADAVYPVSIKDGDGEPYDGSKHKYVLHFDKGQTPPAHAFWSLTMYDNEGFLCSNPINRFAIGDRNTLKKNADGSIDLYIQNESPGKEKESNWLPAPDGAFNLLLRVYWPKDDMLNGTWQAPPVKKNDAAH